MGARGPIPKREAERRRRNKTQEDGTPLEAEVVEISQAVIDDKVTPFTEPNDSWHELAKLQWEAAAESGQSIFYEPTDWAQLYWLCQELSDELGEKVVGVTPLGEAVKAFQPMPGAKMNALMKGFSSLMFTEGDRRRLRLELERGKTLDTMAKVLQAGDVVPFRKSRLG